MSFLEDNYTKIFKKYTTEELKKDISNFVNKKGHCYKFLNHFFEEEIFKSKANKYSKSPYEALNNDEDIAWIKNYVSTKPNFYTSKDEIVNIKSFFKNGTRIARKVANFDIRVAKDIYNRYGNGKKLNILDMCAGFGSRGAAAVLSGHKYTGIDANLGVITQSQKMKEFLIKNNYINEEDLKYIYDGAENPHLELINNFDLMFTSPPYFNLESYSNDNFASSSNYNNYDKWLKDFMIPMLNNTKNYLKIDGLILINCKNLTNLGKQKIFDDVFKILKEDTDLEFVEIFDFKTPQKNFWMNTSYTKNQYKGWKEPVMVFKKKK